MSQFLVVAEQVLRAEQRPLSAKQMTDLGFERGLFSDKSSGATPWQTMKSKLSVEIRSHGQESRFVRTAPGVFFLRDLAEGRVYEAARWQPPPTDEQVMVFPSRALADSGLSFQGVTKTVRRRYDLLLRSGICHPMPRSEAEQTEEFKQVLTYVLVRRSDEVLAYRRGSYNRVEQMLKGAGCVGFGGHVAAEDRGLFSDDDVGLYEAAARELNEELRLPLPDRRRLESRVGLELVGFLNDDSSDVGRRHFAALFTYEVSDVSEWDRPQRGENSINQLRWIQPGDPTLRLQGFEYWSQLALRDLYPKQVKVQPSFHVRHRKAFVEPHLLVLVGPLGSGKTQAAKALRERYGYAEVNSGRVLAGLLGLDPVPVTPRDVFQEAAGDFIARPDGPRRLARALHEAVQAAESPRVLVDGVRHRSTLQALTSMTEGVRTAVVFVHTPPDVAFKLYRRREQPSLRIEGFLTLRAAAAEIEVESLIGQSDAVLYNWLGVESYQAAIDALMRDLGLPRASAGP